MEVALSSLIGLITSPYLMMLMLIAIPIGTFFGALPGLGGKIGIVLLIPFVFGMDPVAGAVFLLAMHSVVHTGGAVPSILFGVPGDGPTAATVLDGYAMAKNGEAGRALGASFGASGIGGLIGAVFLGIMMPLIHPIILSFSPAEFFFVAILGITFIAVLSGNNLVKGLIVGLFGLVVATIGLDPVTGGPRYTFGQLFLWDGLDVITGVLAMFAIPEMIALALKKEDLDAPVAKGKALKVNTKDVWSGVWDCFRHWSLTIRTSIVGAFIGMIPGLGGDAASWICYGHAVQSSKTPEKFGHGMVEGVIAPETANNSKEGGALLPTLFFAVPGSSGMALMLGAFLMLGIQPGPNMLTNDLPLVWSLIWALAVANIMCAIVLVLVSPWLSALAYMKTSVMVPFVLMFALLGCYLGASAWENLLLLVVFGIIGYMFKRHSWPRPPFVIGLVLGPIAEDSLLKAFALDGMGFVLRPISLILISMIIATIAFYFWKMRKPGAIVLSDV